MKTLFTLFIGIAVLTTVALPLTAQGQSEATATTTEKKVKKAKSFPFKFEKSLKKAKAKAAKLNVPIMLLYTNPETCPYCVKLEKEVLNTSEWKKGVAGKLIGVYIDNASKDREAAEFRKSHGVSGIPTFFILKPDGSVIRQGGYSGSNVASYVKAIESAYNTVQSEAKTEE